MANTLNGYRSRILNYYDDSIRVPACGGGPLEGIDNKIKTRKRQAYGYRNAGDFEPKLDALREAKFALIRENTPAHRDCR